ncbi:MAG: prohibitin family protein, partial [Anaerolineae bacterium]|nr:prohibitin family protein [Anaerolineae bacterium]
SMVALLGFALFIIGLVLVVTSSSQGRPVRGGIVLAVVGLALGGLLTLVSGGILVVEPTQVAVVTNTLNGTLEEPARGAGTTVILPMIQTATLYDVRQQEYTMSATSDEGARQGDDAVEATTVDGQQVRVDITVIFSVDPVNANTVHLRFGNDREQWISRFLRPTARTVVRDVISTLPAEEIYGLRRNEMQAQMEEAMRTRMAAEGFTLSSFLVRGLQFSADFTQAIEDKEIAQQRVQQADQDAQRARTVAQGERDAVILRAEGDRDAAIAIAQGQAESLRLVSEQIAANPALIQYEYIRNLSDNVRLILVPSNSPYLFDFNSLLPDGEFVAPDVPGALPTTTP